MSKLYLPGNFELNRYGLHTRLVVEDDAEFIVQLRTNPVLGRFIHSTDNDVEKQKEWIRNYKEKEKAGREYYFIHYIEGAPFGLSRLYGIEEDHCTEGSWVCRPIDDFSKSVASLVVTREILFENLGLDYDIFDVRKENKKVQKIHKISGAINTGETELDYLYKLTRDAFYENRDWLIRTFEV